MDFLAIRFTRPAPAAQAKTTLVIPPAKRVQGATASPFDRLCAVISVAPRHFMPSGTSVIRRPKIAQDTKQHAGIGVSATEAPDTSAMQALDFSTPSTVGVHVRPLQTRKLKLPPSVSPQQATRNALRDELAKYSGLSAYLRQAPRPGDDSAWQACRDRCAPEINQFLSACKDSQQLYRFDALQAAKKVVHFVALCGKVMDETHFDTAHQICMSATLDEQEKLELICDLFCACPGIVPARYIGAAFSRLTGEFDDVTRSRLRFKLFNAFPTSFIEDLGNAVLIYRAHEAAGKYLDHHKAQEDQQVTKRLAEFAANLPDWLNIAVQAPHYRGKINQLRNTPPPLPLMHAMAARPHAGVGAGSLSSGE